MKIRKIKIENNPILRNIELDFTDSEGMIFNTILFVGENGSGKSTLLDIIFDFSNYKAINSNNEKRVFEVEFSNSEIDEINNKINELKYEKILDNNKLIFEFDSNKGSSLYQQVFIYFINSTGKTNLEWNIFNDLKSILKSIFSDVSINFTPKKITNVSNIDTDIEVKTSLRSTENISTEITQMLVDIDNKDSGELKNWVVNNKGLAPGDDIIEVRLKRFKNAFKEIFNDTIIYSGIENLKPIFKKGNNKIEIDKLSSGEKQIVFRGSYLLKDKESIKGAIALIDEPEISLHPIWQQKILNFYQKLFIDNSGKQTSQLFITTHSPYLLQNFDYKKGCIFIFPGAKKLDELPTYIGEKPSIGTINYFAYHLPTIEFHNELYAYIHINFVGENKKLEKIDEYFENKNLFRSIDWIDNKKGKKDKTYKVTLQTFIRNKIHHPENTKMQKNNYDNEKLKKSIDEMIEIIEKEKNN